MLSTARAWLLRQLVKNLAGAVRSLHITSRKHHNMESRAWGESHTALAFNQAPQESPSSPHRHVGLQGSSLEGLQKIF